VPPSNLLCLTGLASDADHLAGSVLAGADRRQTLYEGSDHAVPSPLDVVLELSEALRDSARGHESGRPFGVQCLVVGLVPPRRRAKAAETSPAFAIYTLDPGGGYRHWGAATAIGRGAGRVRRNVHELLLSTSGGASSGGGLPRTAEDALRLALNATMAAFEADLPPPSSSSAPVDDDASHYAALVLEAGAGSRGTEEPDVGVVDPRRVRAVVRELVGSRSAAREAGNYI
jgi:20S proteasome alpha/beta subunit